MQYNVTYRSKDGKIQAIVSYKDQRGKWRQRSEQGFTKKKDAKKAAERIVEELKEAHGLQLNKELEGITFAEFMEIHIEHLKLYKEPNTVTNYQQTAKKFSQLDNIGLAKITTMHVQAALDDMLRAGLKPSTIQSHTNRLKTLFKAAVSQYKIIARNPGEGTVTPKKQQATKNKALSKKDLEELLGSITSQKKHTMSLLAAKCGLRLGEIVGLTWDDIDMKKGLVDINKQWKKRKDGTWGFGELKSKASYRVVPAPKAVLVELHKYRQMHPASMDRRLFSYSMPGAAGTELNNYYKALGYNISIHDLRHTFATMLIAGGTDYRTAAQILGHTPEETIRTYSHVTSDMMERASAAIEDIFG